MKSPPVREHLHRLTNVYAKNPLYFITCCTAHRRRVLAAREVVSLIVESFGSAPDIHQWFVGRYVVMPDHIHFFARPAPDAKRLSAFIRDWKKWTTRGVVKIAGITPPLWQSEFFDHVLRSAESYSEKWDYVRQNPVRAGLVSNATEWPFAGECERLVF